MKRFLFALSLFFILGAKAQITYVNNIAANNYFYLAKFTIGYKYVNVDLTGHNIKLYNLNQTVYKSISVPIIPGATVWDAVFVTDKLFDLDTSIEYILYGNSGTGASSKLYIYDESGSLLFFRDSADIYQNATIPSPARNADLIYFDGISTKMQLRIWSTPMRYEVYRLPGNLPCTECTQGLITGMTTESEGEEKAAQFYPNPASANLKLKYKLPPGAKKAFIKVYDMQGKEVQNMEITNAFDNILLPANYNNGLYLYSLIVDGVVIKNEKIVLTK
jgi:hypothetical protein